jgi:glycosyltransferase involved in cell wall biosynthesis
MRHRAKRLRIGLVVPSLERGGGVPAVAAFVCDTIERSGAFELTVVSLAVSARDELGVALTRPTTWFRGVRTSEDQWRGRRFVRVGAFASELEFQRFRPRPALATALAECDLVQVVCGSPAFALSVCGLGKPVAVHCATRAVVERRTRQIVEHGALGVWRRWMTSVTDRMDREALQAVDAIQAMNAWMFEYARQVNAKRRVILRRVTPGVDPSRFTPAVTRNLQSDPYVLCVGRLNDERKNVDLLLRAFAALPVELREHTRFLLAGSSAPPPRFWSRARQLGVHERVRFVDSPTIAELIELYQNASVFALTSNEEGFGVVIIEAMACGIPVVSTRSGGPDEIIQDAHDGYLVELDDADAFADRLARLLSRHELNVRMGSAARQTILARFDSRVAGTALLSTYDELLGGPRAAVQTA